MLQKTLREFSHSVKKIIIIIYTVYYIKKKSTFKCALKLVCINF